MRKIFIISGIAVLLAACSAPTAMQVKVSPLGQQVSDANELGVYVLPRTVLKVDVILQESKSVPGPFREYAEKYLGIKEVIRQNESKWQILDFQLAPYSEVDPQMAFQMHLMEGSYSNSTYEIFLEKGLILDGSDQVQEGIRGPELGISEAKDYVRFKDLGITSNFEEKSSTMYKTIITDTGFVDVPVNRTITEQKSLSIKAQEAADFILELRTRRFELLTGEYDAFPQGVAMQAALDKLDKLEADYLSLFAGKTLLRKELRSWFLVPESGSDPSSFPLGVFSQQLGMVPEGMMEGTALKISLEPTGSTRNLDAYFSGKKIGDELNILYYRIPDVVELKLMLGATELARQRVSVYQAGALMSAPL